ncbi:MAG: tetratricopeptide repeat protein [bacterium]|nr:hypothetical protein [Planctomycetota bacterium]HIL51013.1 hypothetical protein [Planctomycetota bacterium]
MSLLLLSAVSTALLTGPALDDWTVPSATVASLGAERCATCHRGVVKSYTLSGMARALGLIQLGELGDLDPVQDGPAAITYAFAETQGASPWITESWKSGMGAERHTVRRKLPLLFRIGAGILDRSYAARHGRSMWFAPLEVLSTSAHGERHAVLAPGHMMVPGSRFTTPISIECLACHTGALPPETYPHNLLPPEDWQPTGIACVVCHGRAEAHADWRDQELAGEAPAVPDPILRHDNLDLSAQLSMCARCHLQGDARIALKPGLRGISAPGVNHLEEWAVYLPSNSDGDVAFVSQTERMMRSRCFTESLKSRPMTCITCHDPHRSLTVAGESQAVRDACLDCHGESRALARACAMAKEERTGERDCVACHMPKTQVFDVDGVEIRDHFVRIQSASPERGPLRIKHCRDGLLEPVVWPGGDAAALQADFGLQLMAAIIARQSQSAKDLVDFPPGSISKGLPSYHHLRGRLLEELGRMDHARESYERAIALDSDAPETRVNLALMLGALGRVAEGIGILDALLERYPGAEGALRNRAILRLNSGDGAGFAADLMAAQRLLPRASLARALASYYRQLGELGEASAWEDEAGRLEP